MTLREAIDGIEHWIDKYYANAYAEAQLQLILKQLKDHDAKVKEAKALLDWVPRSIGLTEYGQPYDWFVRVEKARVLLETETK